MKKVLMMGDVHGRFIEMNKILNTIKPDITIQTGDFGYWPKFKTQQIEKPTGKLYWIDGNHEDHDSLMERENDELWPNIIYKPRGSTLTLPDNRKVLFMGGADSIDKQYRTQGYDWFIEELITEEDIHNLPDTHIDIVVSHTVPQFIKLKGLYEIPDISRFYLNEVYDKYRPTQWYAGHFHFYNKQKFNNCTFTILSSVGYAGTPYELLK